MEFHIHCEAKDIARYAFVPGDHSRAKKIADHFEKPNCVALAWYNIYTGHWDGIRRDGLVHWHGRSSVAICIEELAHLGVDTFIRVASCGTMQLTCIVATCSSYRHIRAADGLTTTSCRISRCTKFSGANGAGQRGKKAKRLSRGHRNRRRCILRAAMPHNEKPCNSRACFRRDGSDTLFVISSLRDGRGLFSSDGT